MVRRQMRDGYRPKRWSAISDFFDGSRRIGTASIATLDLSFGGEIEL